MTPVVRTRLGLGLISLAVIGLELTFMRGLSLRFWSHFAYMVIGVALLGFGASGTAITLLRGWIVRHVRAWLCGSALAFSMSIPLTWWASQEMPLDVGYLAWNLSQVGNVIAMELVMLVPFLLAGAFVGVALMDRPQRVGGHYAANLIGSGVGAVASVAAMYVLSPVLLLCALTAAAYLAGAVLLPWRDIRGAMRQLYRSLWRVLRARNRSDRGTRRPLGTLGRGNNTTIVGAVAALAALIPPWAFYAAVCAMPLEPVLSPYKMLAQVLTWPGTKVIHQSEGPLGRIDVVAGPSIHHAPGLSLQCTEPIPSHVLLIVDGDQTSAVYECRRTEDWAFMDYTTAAAPYHLRKRPSVCVIGAGGGADIGLALFHGSPDVVALEMNGQIIEAMTGPLASLGGAVYRAPGVRVVNQEARGYFASTGRGFQVIQLPAIDAFGASGAGMYATQESYLYTVEAVEAMLDRLSPDGVLCITRWARTPPRDELRAFDLAAQALRKRGLDPARHLAMIRSWVTVTVLVFGHPILSEDANGIRDFCGARSFDLCWLPGLDESEVNRYHLLDQPYYFQAARALVGPQREAFLSNYAFEIAAPTDAKPYFFHSFRWRALPVLAEQLRGASHAFLEVGYLMVVAALLQTVAIALLLILLPLVPGIKAIGHARGKAASLGYFLLLGVGFMLLEMGFLQKLILYLSHPIYSAAAVIASFLIFGGLGSQFSHLWPWPLKRIAALGAGAVVCLSLTYLLVMDGWLRLTQAEPVWVRFAIAAGTIAPLAFAMGHMFPTGLRQVGGASPALVPWAWAVNGFASVVATVAAPLLAMNFGFPRVALAAAACYALAGLLSRALPAAPCPLPVAGGSSEDQRNTPVPGR
jgi:hypothetical protein